MVCGKDDLTKKSGPGINGTYHAKVYYYSYIKVVGDIGVGIGVF